MSKTIPQLDAADPLNLLNKIEVSQSDSKSAESKRVTLGELISEAINPNAQLEGSNQVDGLDAQLSTLNSDIGSLQTTKMTKSANLSDVSSRSTAQANIGFSGAPVTLAADTDVVLTNPIPTFITTQDTVNDHIIQLPAVNATNSQAYSQNTVVYVPAAYNRRIVKNSAGTVLATVLTGQAIMFVLESNGTAPGTWSARGQVFDVNGLTGKITLKGADINTDYSAPGYTAASTTLDGQFEGISDKFLSLFGVKVVEVTGTTQTIAAGTVYIANNASLVTFTLPASIAIGQKFEIIGKGAGGWRIAQLASQFINFGDTVTTTGVGGSLSSTNQYDAVTITCTTANLQFSCSAPQGQPNAI